ncbi:MAG: hypothetical protein ACLUN9_20870 [Enterocloster aldenensis]
MREDHTVDMELNKEMEDIRQVPLEPGSRTAPGRERPVGASYTGGAARPGRGAPGMDEGGGSASRSGAAWMKAWAGSAAARGMDEGMGGASGGASGGKVDRRPGRAPAWRSMKVTGRARRRPDPRDMDVPGRGEIGKRGSPSRQARTFQRGRGEGTGAAGARPPKPGINGPASRLLNQRRVKSRSGRMTRQGSSPLIPREKYHGAAKKGKVFPLWRSCLC